MKCVSVDTYWSLRDKMVELFADHDPQGLIGLGASSDEYINEALWFVDRVVNACSKIILHQLLFEVFRDGFFPLNVGPPEKYMDLAKDVYKFLEEVGLVEGIEV